MEHLLQSDLLGAIAFGMLFFFCSIMLAKYICSRQQQDKPEILASDKIAELGFQYEHLCKVFDVMPTFTIDSIASFKDHYILSKDYEFLICDKRILLKHNRAIRSVHSVDFVRCMAKARNKNHKSSELLHSTKFPEDLLSKLEANQV